MTHPIIVDPLPDLEMGYVVGRDLPHLIDRGGDDSWNLTSLCGVFLRGESIRGALLRARPVCGRCVRAAIAAGHAIRYATPPGVRA